ncbi:MAG: shikimate dehydrogenase [Gemmatimonadota bacterium]|nr:shikimate dehydrogenase [Gemmatimonadota bacterium]
MSVRPERLVLLGSPVDHSLSPVFQNAALRSAGLQKIHYDAIDVSPPHLASTLAALRDERAAGNITLPHKEAAYALCDFCLPEAVRAGAVNTFWSTTQGELFGTNTDIGGFDNTARQLLGDAHADAKIALLGAGGAARAVLAAIEQWPGAEVVLWNRTRERAERLADRFDVIRRIDDDPRAAVHGATCVINATSIGLANDDQPVSLDDLSPSAVVMDLVYRAGGTAWVRAAVMRGMRASDGLPMLIEQGALAFEAWFGFPAPRTIMRQSIER